MTRLFALLGSLSLFGCVTAIPYTYQERCSMNGMKLTGVDLGNGASVAFNPLTHTMMPIASASQSVRCEVPKDAKEEDQVRRINAQLVPKSEYNESLGTKAFITDMGYILGIAPGIYFKIHYDGQRTEAIQQSQEIYEKYRSTASADPLK